MMDMTLREMQQLYEECCGEAAWTIESSAGETVAVLN